MPDYAPIYFTLSDSPRAILGGMSRYIENAKQVQTVHGKRKRIPFWLFLGGVVCFFIDVVFLVAGFPVCLFSVVGAAAWVGALVAFFALRKAQVLEVPPRYETVRQILNTLRDDQAPKKPVTGFLDLTGLRKNEKMVRTMTNAANLPVDIYRDEWLSLKMRLYDGNVLRLSLLETQKIRRGYQKRGATRMKWKPPKEKPSEQVIKVQLAINSDVYETVNTQTSLAPGAEIGPYRVQNFTYTGGWLSLSATAPNYSAVDAGQVLGLLRAVYDQLQRKGV